MRPTRSQLQRYLLAAERAPVDAAVAAWARGVLESLMLRAEREDRRTSLPPKPERVVYHTR